MLSTIESGADVLYIEGDILGLLQIASRGCRLTSVAASAEGAERIKAAAGFSEIRRFWNPRAPQRFFNWEQNPLLSPILQHFRHGETGAEVEFLEMDGKRNEYLKLFGLSDEFA